MNLTQDPIPELIRRIAIPASIGFFFNTMYNIVDTYFGGLLSKDALAGMSISFPMFIIIIAIGSGVGQGATALISNAMGAGKPEKGQAYFIQSILFGVLSGLVLTVLGWIAAPGLFRYLGAEGPYLDTALEFMNGIIAGSVFFVLQMTLNAVLNARGETRVFRNTLIGSFLLNCFLDPWLMYGGFGVPRMGVGGIALSTDLAQIAGCVYMFYRIRKMSLWDGVTTASFRPNWPVIREILGQALPASLNMVTVSLGIFVITKFVSDFGKEGVAAYGIATRIEQVILLPTIGLNFAVLSIVGQNYGAGRMDRVRDAWVTTLRYGLIMMVVGGVLLFFCKGVMMTWFTGDKEVIRRGTDYLGIAAITQCAYVILFQTVYMLQGMKKPMFGLWIGLYRQIAAPIAVFHLLSFTLGWGLWGVWWGVCFVTWSAALITLGYGGMVLRDKIVHRTEE